jgi:hypothetical protein
MDKSEFNQALKRLGTTPFKIAADIGVSQRQAYRYASGETEVPPAMAILVRMLLKGRRTRKPGKSHFHNGK